MKITDKTLIENNFNLSQIISKQGRQVFEDYLRNALLELEKSSFLKEAERQKIKVLSDKLEFSLHLLDRLAQGPINTSLSSTIGDFLLTQAFEMEKIAETLPEGALKNLFKESALYIGIEAEKVRQGFYQD